MNYIVGDCLGRITMSKKIVHKAPKMAVVPPEDGIERHKSYTRLNPKGHKEFVADDDEETLNELSEDLIPIKFKRGSIARFDNKLTQVLTILESGRSIYYKSMRAFRTVQANRDEYKSLEEYWSALVEAAMPAIRAVAELKLSNNAGLSKGLMTRLNKSDLDDLVQSGALYGWKYLQSDSVKKLINRESEFAMWDWFMQNVKSGMERGGYKDFRITGDLPYNISNERYKEVEGDPWTHTDADYDVRQIEQPVNHPREEEIEQALRAIDRAGLSPKVGHYFRDTLAGLSVTDIAKKYGVSKPAVVQALKGRMKNLNRVRKVLGDSKENYIEKLNLIFGN